MRPGDFLLVDILTLVWPPTGIVAWVVGRDRLVGDGDGRDLLDAVDAGLDELDREVDGAANLEKWQFIIFRALFLYVGHNLVLRGHP